MTAAAESRLAPKSMLPVFKLTSTDGQTISTWDFKGIRNMVLAFLPGECPVCEEFIYAASSAYHRYIEENAALLAIVRGDPERAKALSDQLNPPFHILSDQDGVVTEKYTDRIPAVFVADKFGELYEQWVPGPGGSLPAQKEILDVLELINLECPE